MGMKRNLPPPKSRATQTPKPIFTQAYEVAAITVTPDANQLKVEVQSEVTFNHGEKEIVEGAQVAQ